MTIFYVPNPAQYLNLTTTLLTINYQQIRSLLIQKSYGLLMVRIRLLMVRTAFIWNKNILYH